MEFAKRVTLIGRGSQNGVEENWFVFARDVAHLFGTEHQIADNNRLTVEIAFQVSDYESDGRPNVIKLQRSYLNVLFATARETHLGFLIQGPFRTTPARDNVSSQNEYDKKFNLALAKESGELVVEALRWLRDRDWLTVDVLETMPLAYTELEYRYDSHRRQYGYFPKERNRYSNTLFAPIYECVKRALTNEALIPSFGGGYVAAKNGRIAGSEALRKLLETPQLQQLLEFDEQTRWLSKEITSDNTEKLWEYLTAILEIEEIDAEMFVRRIDHDFMSNQSDDWIRRFYEFATTGNTMLNILRDKPIIRLEDGSHVKPFHGNDPRAYLPKDHESRYPTVKSEVCNSEKSLEFLKKLGLKRPDDVDEVLTLILPKYRHGQDIDEDNHWKDIESILRALHEVDSIQRQLQLVNSLNATPFLWATNSMGDSALRRPGEIYLRSSAMETYFEGNPDSWFLSELYDEFYDELYQLEIQDTVRVSLERPDKYGYVPLSEPWGERGSTYDPYVGGQGGFDPNFTVDGLEFAMRHPSIDRAQYIWNMILSKYRFYISGNVVKSTRYDYSKVFQSVPTDSVTGKLVRENPWLPDKLGNFFNPSELSLDDLSNDFHRDDELADALGMNESRYNIDDAPEDLKALVAVAQGRSPEEVEEALALLDEKKDKERENVDVFEPEEHTSEFLGEFYKTRSSKTTIPPIDDFPLDTPEDKRIKTELEIGSEPDPEERYELRIKRIWKPKNPETRKFLNKEYPEGCQIHNCNHSFLKRDGLPYFEAVHIIPRTSAQWLDHPRNAVCLCAHHAAQWKHGERSTADLDILEQIRSSQEGLEYNINVELCGGSHDVVFTANHIDEVRIALEVTEYM